MALSYVLGGALLSLGIFFIFINYARQITNFIHRKQEGYNWSSPKPLVGPLLVIVGSYALPINISDWIFLVLLLDPDTLLVIVSIPYMLVKAVR